MNAEFNRLITLIQDQLEKIRCIYSFLGKGYCGENKTPISSNKYARLLYYYQNPLHMDSDIP